MTNKFVLKRNKKITRIFYLNNYNYQTRSLFYVKLLIYMLI